jgi:hypothetical protein
VLGGVIMASMTTEGMREYVKKQYSGDSWKQRVDKMSDSQIVAIYYNMIGKKNKRK